MQSITEYYRVLQSITEYYRALQCITEYNKVLQSITECYRVLQSIAKYYKVLQSITKTNLAHLLGPILGLLMWFYIFVVLFAHHISTQVSLGPSPSTMVCRGWNGAIGEAVTDLQELLPRLLGPLHAEGDRP